MNYSFLCFTPGALIKAICGNKCEDKVGELEARLLQLGAPTAEKAKQFESASASDSAERQHQALQAAIG